MHTYRYRVTIQINSESVISHVGELTARNKESAYNKVVEKYSLHTYPRQQVSVKITKH